MLPREPILHRAVTQGVIYSSKRSSIQGRFISEDRCKLHNVNGSRGRHGYWEPFGQDECRCAGRRWIWGKRRGHLSTLVEPVVRGVRGGRCVQDALFETELPHLRQIVTDSEQLLGFVHQPVVSCVLVLWGRLLQERSFMQGKGPYTISVVE